MWLIPWLWPSFQSRPTIRPAVSGDARRMAEIHADSFAHGWGVGMFDQMLAEGQIADIMISRAMVGQIATGFAISRLIGDEAELMSIALDVEVRGKGYARGLLEAHLATLRRAGALALFLEVADDNEAALALYRRSGFHEIGRRKGYYAGAMTGARRDALTMKRDLSDLDPTPRRLF